MSSNKTFLVDEWEDSGYQFRLFDLESGKPYLLRSHSVTVFPDWKEEPRKGVAYILTRRIAELRKGQR